MYPVFLEADEHLPANSKEQRNFFPLLAQAAFSLSINLSVSQSMSSCTFNFLILSTVPPREGEWAVVWCCLPVLNCNSMVKKNKNKRWWEIYYASVSEADDTDTC